MRIARAFQSEIESVFVEDAAAVRLRRLQLRARGVADADARAGPCRRAGMTQRPAARGPGRAATARGDRAAGRGAAALARRARRTAAGAIDCLRRVGALERGGAGRAVRRRQSCPAQAAAVGGFRRDRARHGRAEGTARHRPRRHRRGGYCATAGPCCAPPSAWPPSTAPRSCCC